MALNLELFKKHPYATGTVVIVGGIAVFYFLSRGKSSVASGASGSSDYASALSADTALQQANAAAAIQTNGQQVALQTAQLNAQVATQQTSASEDVSNTQTLASLAAALSNNSTSLEVAQSNNAATTLQQANTLTSQQNIYSIQEAGLQDQINQAEIENANNNATSLAGLVDQLNAQGQIATQVISSATGLATQQQNYQQQNVQSIIPLIGKQYNTGNDANRATAIEQTILTGGNPYVANSGNNLVLGATQSGNAKTANILSSISRLGSNIATGFFGT